MKRNGFTLIEIMVVISIIGVLAAIALPAYKDYTIRAKTSELMLALDGCKTSVMEYKETMAAWPPDQTASGCGDQNTRYVEKIVVADTGTITVTAKTGAGAIDTVAAGDIQLTPTESGTGHIDWNCRGPGTTIPKKFLPASCR